MITSKRLTNIGFTLFFKQTSVMAIVLIVILLPYPVNAFDILLGTGATGTFSHFAGRTIGRVINRHTDAILCKTVSAPSDVSNLTNLQGGSLDIAIVDSLMLHDAINKTGYFEYLDINYNNIRAVVSLYDVPFTFVVRSDARIHSLDMLKGKRINVGAPRSLQHLAADVIFKIKNWKNQDFSLVEELPSSHAQDTMAFCHGTIQAMVSVNVHPDSSLLQLFRLCKAGLLDMDDPDIEKLTDTHPAFSKITLSSDTYSSYPRKVTTFGTRAVLVASGDLDDQTVYQIIDALYSNRKSINRAHPAFSLILDAAKISDFVVPLHPGAAKYFSRF